MPLTRTDRRRMLREQRRQLSERAQAEAANRLLHQIRRLRLYRTSERLACYFPKDGEIDPSPILEHAWSLGKHCYLPVLSRWQKTLSFAEVLPGMLLVPNRLRIPEPVSSLRTRLTARDLDLILMPLVGFDVEGNRLGMGGGFYDRTLAFLHHRHSWIKPRLLGLAHDFQRIDRLPVEPWDVPLQGVVTDRAFYPGSHG